MSARLAAGLLAGLLIALSPIGSAKAAPFRLIVTELEPPLLPNSVMELALNEGYFTREGMEVELVRVQQTPSAIAAIAAGEGEMANIGLDALLQLHARGATDLVAVMSPNKSLPFLIAASTSVDEVGDLAGRSFGVGRLGSLDHSLSLKVLEAGGVDADSLNVVPLGQPNVRAQALAAGRIDATTMSIGVWLTLPERQGLRVLVDQEEYFRAAPVLNKVNVVPPAVLRERPEEVRAVIRALVRASRDFAAKPQRWSAAMASLVPHVDRTILDELATSFAGSWSVNGGLSRAELDVSEEWLFQGADFEGLEPAPLEEWVDFNPIDDVLAELGVDASADPADR